MEENINLDIYRLQRVILSPVSDNMQLGNNLEPPFVRVRTTNSNLILLDSSQTSAQFPPNNISATLERELPRINRLSLLFVEITHLFPNINPRNNTFAFFKTGIRFEFTIPETNLLGLARYQALVAGMNSATGIPGDFTVAAHPYIPNAYIITNAVAALWRFDDSAIGVQRGRYLWGFNFQNTSDDTPSHVLVTVTESYTRYIDFASAELTLYSKIDASGVKATSDLIVRMLLNDTKLGDKAFIDFKGTASINFDRSRGISRCDIQIYDEFRQYVYIPQDCWGSFIFDLILLAEM